MCISVRALYGFSIHEFVLENMLRLWHKHTAHFFINFFQSMAMLTQKSLLVNLSFEKVFNLFFLFVFHFSNKFVMHKDGVEILIQSMDDVNLKFIKWFFRWNKSESFSSYLRQSFTWSLKRTWAKSMILKLTIYSNDWSIYWNTNWDERKGKLKSINIVSNIYKRTHKK